MPNLPSFRPRGDIGIVGRNGSVAPTKAFLRFLDQVGRVSDTDNNAILQNAQDIAQNAASINTNANAITALAARVTALEDNTRTPAATTYVASAPADPASTEYT